MASHFPPAGALLCSLLGSALLAAPVHAQMDLPLGSMTTAQVGGEDVAHFEIEVGEAGFLTVVVRSTAGEDVLFTVTDDEYQVLPEGSVDMDVGGDVGAEQFVIALPRPGVYRVLVESYGFGGASFQIGGSFLPWGGVAAPPDPDGKPSGARDLALDSDHEDTLDPAGGDGFDWYRVTSDAAGTLTVLTRAESGDLRLDLFLEGDFREPVDTSDQDQGGVLGNESLTVDLAAGQTVYVRVGPSAGTGDYSEYRIASGFIGG